MFRVENHKAQFLAPHCSLYIWMICIMCAVKLLPSYLLTTPIYFYRGKDLTVLVQEIDNELSQTSLWLKSNKLSLNIKKTHFMVFHRKKIDGDIKIKIDDEEIDRVYKTKFLGVMIDHKITWKEHVKYVSGKMSRNIGIFIKARNCLNKHAMMTLYYSFIYPDMAYCKNVWGRTHKSNTKRVYDIRKRALFIIMFNLGKRSW